MRVKVEDYTPKVFADKQQKANLALRLITSAIVNEATPKTPKDEGDLRLNVLKQVLGSKARITWRQPYAQIQEEKQFKNYTTPGTGPHYAENAVVKIFNEAVTYFRQVGLVKE